MIGRTHKYDTLLNIFFLSFCKRSIMALSGKVLISVLILYQRKRRMYLS